MNQLAGFAILLFASLLLIVSSVTNVKVTAQGNSSNAEKPTSEKTFTRGPSAETTVGANCPAGEVKDYTGICSKESEAKACPTCNPGSAANPEIMRELAEYQSDKIVPNPNELQSDKAKLQGANNTGPATPNQVTTTTQQLLPALHHPTPIVTTTHHNIVTATSEQLSNNGILPKPTLAPKPTEATVAPRVQGAMTIAEAQQLKKAEEKRLAFKKLGEHFQQERMRRGIQFDPKKEICEGNTATTPGKVVCLPPGKVVPRPINPGSLAMHLPRALVPP